MNTQASLAQAGWLIEPSELAALIADPRRDVRVVDMRGFVRTADVGDGVQEATYLGAEADYLSGHIPGAVYIDWTRDIVDSGDPVPVQVAPPAMFERAMGRAGIGDATLVVAYDAHPSSQFATRLWWALRYYGHEAVRVLNGGWRRWLQEGRPTETGAADPPAAVFHTRPVPGLRVTAADVAAAIGDAGTVIVDARDAEQYSGVARRGSRGGHVPGAVNLPREELVADDGTFLPAAEIARRAQRHGIDPSRRVIAYCNGGVAATSVLFGLSMAGWDNLANYDGSWNEWSERPELPVEPCAPATGQAH